MARSTITVASFTEVTGPAPTRGRTIRMEQKHENEEQPLVGTDPGWRIPLLLAQPSKLHRDCQDGLRDQCRAFQGMWAVSAAAAAHGPGGVGEGSLRSPPDTPEQFIVQMLRLGIPAGPDV
jgi:hypothetical protein